jgi:hypothetical protein
MVIKSQGSEAFIDQVSVILTDLTAEILRKDTRHYDI